MKIYYIEYRDCISLYGENENEIKYMRKEDADIMLRAIAAKIGRKNLKLIKLI